MLGLEWTDFKQLIDTNQIKFKELPVNGGYWLFGYDNAFQVQCRLTPDVSDWSYKAEYEGNYQSLASVLLENDVVTNANTYPFAQKETKDGKKLFKRKNGIEFTLDGTLNKQSAVFTIPYTSCLMTGAEIINAQIGDKLDFFVLDTVAGTVSGTPSLTLNQFGFNVYPASGYYKDENSYDSSLFAGLQIKIDITPVNTDARSLYINLNLHELV